MSSQDPPTKQATGAGHLVGVRPALGRIASRIAATGRSLRDGFLWAVRGFIAGNRFSSLTRRIVVFQVVALLVLVAGVLYLNQFRQGLIDARKQALLVQAEIIAGAVAETATDTPEAELIDPLAEIGTSREWIDPDVGFAERDIPISAKQATPILRRLVLPTQTRARLYDKDGWPILDSRQLSASEQVETFILPPPGGAEELGFFAQIADWARRTIQGRGYQIYREAGMQNGRFYEEVGLALSGLNATMERLNSKGELIVSVAVPIQRFRAVLGVLLLSTEGGDIDAIVRAERLAIVEVFLVALGVAILLSVVLAGTIAEPVRRLAETADRAAKGVTQRVEIPDFTNRRDEIGDLSGALRGMTTALYARMDAIEAFAADVAHELKNPLTSIRSAVETLEIAKDGEARARLMEIIQHDIRRIDRLISDISEASRLDAELSREELVPMDLGTLSATIIDLFNATGTQDGKRVTLSAGSAGSAGPEGGEKYPIAGSDRRLGQVLRNLIDNALSFSPEGGKVMLTLARTDEKVILTVEDEGPGIPEHSLERIFDRFHTDREGDFGKHSGLGLSISKQIVEAHRGHLRAANREEGGACFTLELPRAASSDGGAS